MKMRVTAVLLSAAFMGWTGAAFGQDACTKPTAPAAVDGATANMEQLLAAKKEVSDFITASDVYQTCVLDSLEAQRKAAKAEKRKLDPAVQKTANESIAANQADKERVGADFNAAARAYKAAHPS